MKNQIETNEPINITPMTVEEAKECDAEIHMHLDAADKHLDAAGALLLSLKRREGWKALGFSTWTEYLESRAVGGKSRRRVLELLQAEEVKENLVMCGIPHMNIPTVTSQLTMLAQLPLEQQPVGLQKADELAMTEGKKRTANHITRAVKEIKSVAQETAALGKSLGLSTGGDSVLPQSDLLDDLTHTSPADVDDRLGAPSPRLYRHQVGEIVFVSNQSKMPFEQRMWSRWWGVVKSVGDVSVTVSFGQREEKFMALDLIRHEQLSSQFHETCQKILNLWQEELEPMEAIILRELQHKEAFTPWEIQLISWMESQHTKLN